MRTPLQQFNAIEKVLKEEGGVFSLQNEADGFAANMMYGKEAPDSPMFGSHAMGFGDDATAAIDEMLDQMRV